LSTADSRRVLQVLVAVIIALVFFSAGYIASPGKTTTERIHEVYTSTVTDTTTLTRTMVSTTTETTTVYRDINVTVYSQDPDVNVTVAPIYSGGLIQAMRIYVTNNGNTSKTNLLLTIISVSPIYPLYKEETHFIEIDVIEPGVTLRYDIDIVKPADRYYVFLLK